MVVGFHKGMFSCISKSICMNKIKFLRKKRPFFNIFFKFCILIDHKKQ